MIQLGYIEAKGSLNYVERKLIRPFAFNIDSWRQSEHTYVIDKGTVYGICRNNEKLKELMDNRDYVYAEGHVVRNEPRFVRKEGNKYVLTDLANSHVDDCCLRFVRQYRQENIGQFVYGRMYYDPEYVARTLFYLNDTMNRKHLDELDAKIDYVESFPRTFIKAFDLIMKQNGETREGVAFRLHMSDNTLREWLNNPEGKIRLDFIVTITLMWKIPEWISKLLIDRAMIRISEYDRRHQALEYVRTILWDQGVEEANKYLASKGQNLIAAYEDY